MDGSKRTFRLLSTMAVLLIVLTLGILFMGTFALASELKADEEVIFFPTAGYLNAENSRWVVPVHGWVFEPEEDSIWRSALVEELL